MAYEWKFRPTLKAPMNCRLLPSAGPNGVRVEVQANLEGTNELSALAQCGADGVGLYRTEFAYFTDRLPSEEDLLAEYAAVAQRTAPDRVVFRTLDVGADKMLHAQAVLKEPKPGTGFARHTLLPAASGHFSHTAAGAHARRGHGQRSHHAAHDFLPG